MSGYAIRSLSRELVWARDLPTWDEARLALEQAREAGLEEVAIVDERGELQEERAPSDDSQNAPDRG